MARAQTALVLILVSLASACARGPEVAVVAPDGSTRALFRVEVADTEPARRMGLMYRDELASDAGMLFVFPRDERLSFWMRNTRIALDLIFADRTGRVVGVIENAQPFSERPLEIGRDSRFVLEVNAGAAARRGIRPGDRLEFRGFSPAAAD
jgi:uncharacterized membrane protein (UPF0127 family)